MIYEELIHKYLDNDLDETGEETLFQHISSNDELRQEFNRQLRFQNIALRDMQRITVPTELSASIFNQLGFSAPAFQPAGAMATATTREGFSAKHLSILLLLLLLLTSFISYYLMNENSILKEKLLGKSKIGNNLPFMNSEAIQNDNIMDKSLLNSEMEKETFANNGTNNQSENSSNSIIAFSGNSKDNPNVNSSYNSNKIMMNKHTAKNNKNINNHNSILANSSNDANSLLALSDELNNINYNSTIELSQLAKNTDENYSSYSQLRNSNSNSAIEYTNLPNSMNQYNLLNIGERKHYNWSLQFRRLLSNNDPLNSQLVSETNFLTDNAIGVWYSPNNEISYGVEMGAEVFTQEFTNNNLNYLQSPMLNWYGASIRYNPADLMIDDVLNPYLSQTLAYTSVGPLSKTQIGLSYSPINLIALNIGAEYGLLFYSPNNDNIYTSNRLSFIGGISINIK